MNCRNCGANEFEKGICQYCKSSSDYIQGTKMNISKKNLALIMYGALIVPTIIFKKK